jgi:hypothetical protein
LGALVYTVFVEDPVNGNHEKVMLVPWKSDHFEVAEMMKIFVDSNNHIQLPTMAIDQNGLAAIAVKTERLAPKEAYSKVSQVDIFKGNLNDLQMTFEHITANPFVCDTTKQVSELNLAFAGNDTLVLLCQEYPMLAANASFVPVNGVIFGDPYMNLVLRSFAINEAGTVEDVDENTYFLGIPEPAPYQDEFTLVQCYPNPCNDYTTLRFGINKSTRIIIELFDARGVLQANMIDQQLETGLYELEINTAQLETGNYIFRLNTGKNSRSIKLIVGR